MKFLRRSRRSFIPNSVVADHVSAIAMTTNIRVITHGRYKIGHYGLFLTNHPGSQSVTLTIWARTRTIARTGSLCAFPEVSA
jgi:hypothetical protein